MEATFLEPIIIALAVGVSSGAIGSFIILRRMALVGDALSHVALPGIALALFYKIDPFWGVLTFLLLAATLVWWLEGKTRLPAEALVGILFTASLAIGILTIPDTEILESLFGEFPLFPPLVLVAVVSAAVILTALTFVMTRRFLFSIIAPEISKIERKEKWNDLIFFLIFSFAVALGIKLVGTLLMGALTIIPAAIAKNIGRSMTGYMLASSILGGLISVSGVIVAQSYGFLPGPTIILLGVIIFLATLVWLEIKQTRP